MKLYRIDSFTYTYTHKAALKTDEILISYMIYINVNSPVVMYYSHTKPCYFRKVYKGQMGYLYVNYYNCESAIIPK